MLFIISLGTVLRLIFIDKPDGLWNDEYVSWAIASIPLGKKFLSEILAQCHMPFYYFYLKFFIHFFGNSDLMLRLTSVIAGIFSIWSMYFVGKELKDSKLGILCASFTALSSFLIYFSQEVRFYQLLFLFSALMLIYTLKLLKAPDKKSFILYLISSFLVIFTHTIGFVFVFFNSLFLSFWLIKENEKMKKTILITWSSLILIFLALTPLTYKLINGHPLSQWWDNFTLSSIGFLFTDYFSPVLTNIVSAPDNFFYDPSLNFAIFALIPSIIAIVGIIKALQNKNSVPRFLFPVALLYLLVLIVFSISGKLVFMTKYSIEIYPILILLACTGLLEFKKAIRYILIFVFCFLNLFYIISNPNSAPKLHRSEGHKIVANLLKNAQLQKGDYILINYYPKDRFEKYFDFSKYNLISINKGNFTEYLGAKTKDDFLTTDANYASKKIKKEVLSKLKTNQKFSMVILKDVSIYSPIKLQMIIENKKQYKKTPFLFLAFSHVSNQIFQACLEELQILRIEDKGSWTLVVFQK